MTRLALLLAATMLAACGQAAAPPTQVGLENHASVTLGLYVNGVPIATVAPGGSFAGPESALPSPPWTLTVRSPSGRVLATAVDDGRTIAPPPNASAHFTSASASTFGLACGSVMLWTGPSMPAFVEPSPSVPPSGDCR